MCCFSENEIHSYCILLDRIEGIVAKLAKLGYEESVAYKGIMELDSYKDKRQFLETIQSHIIVCPICIKKIESEMNKLKKIEKTLIKKGILKEI